MKVSSVMVVLVVLLTPYATRAEDLIRGSADLVYEASETDNFFKTGRSELTTPGGWKDAHEEEKEKAIDRVYYSDGTTSTKIGGFIFHSDGTSSTQIGNSTYHSDGSSSMTIGNSTYHSNGSSSTQVGNSIFNSDGSSCSKIGSTLYCN